MGSKPQRKETKSPSPPGILKVRLLWTMRHSPLHKKLSFNVVREICEYLEGVGYLPWLHGNTLRVFDPGEKVKKQVTISHNSPYGAVQCGVDEKTIISLGGAPAQDEVFLLDIDTYKLSQVASMYSCRSYPGLLKYSGFVYVFGGNGNESTSCEKYSLSDGIWTRLSNMRHPRFAFSPCLYQEDVYLPDVYHEHRVLETFNLLTEQFAVVPVRLPAFVSNSVSFIVRGELIIVSYYDKVGRCRIDCEDGFRVANVKNRGGGALSSCPPMMMGRKVYWVRHSTGELNAFDLDTDSLELISEPD